MVLRVLCCHETGMCSCGCPITAACILYSVFCNQICIPVPEARFSKLPVITEPVKLFCFPFQMGVSKRFKNCTVKLSAKETKWNLLEDRTHPSFLKTYIWKYDSGPIKLPGLSRNGPLDTVSCLCVICVHVNGSVCMFLCLGNINVTYTCTVYFSFFLSKEVGLKDFLTLDSQMI